MPIVQKRAVRSPRRIDLAAKPIHTELKKALNGYADTLVKELRDITSDWANQPQFVKEILTDDGGEIRVVVRPAKNRKASQIFEWVDLGTKPHIIRPKNPDGVLRFRLGYKAKTLPVAKAHVGPGRASGGWRSAKEVHHPGTKGRQFMTTLQKRTRKEFQKLTEDAFRRIQRNMRSKS